MPQILSKRSAGGTALDGFEKNIKTLVRQDTGGLPLEATIVIVARGGPAHRTLEIAFSGVKSEDLLLDLVEKLDALMMGTKVLEDDNLFVRQKAIQ